MTAGSVVGSQKASQSSNQDDGAYVLAHTFSALLMVSYLTAMGVK